MVAFVHAPSGSAAWKWGMQAGEEEEEVVDVEVVAEVGNDGSLDFEDDVMDRCPRAAVDSELALGASCGIGGHVVTRSACETFVNFRLSE